ncbi:hypothetical protein [Nocardia brasiliensis]|uniref:TPR repeat domain-containing protein n=1 Tax=Nocardia brasiliensis (strain ATCC 700358 / HUJEG-1) TaxID=1133849 RepID=K0F232_NOCB7|nr:hypothetical protein [Nocardia brasiliensis]AFU06233.1 hypothetical protein O3I_041440 [Nocardia brasiliensis ATCC 700358]OCF88587.1 hypothetical protein AW168_19860 [Nocardia brasiliensis]
MPTRKEVEAWRTWALSDWAGRIESGDQAYTAQLERAINHFKNLNGAWAGKAYDAAYDRIGEDQDEGRKLSFEVREFITALRSADGRLSDERRVLLGKVAEAEQDHTEGASFTVLDQWAIQVQYPDPMPEDKLTTIQSRARALQDAINTAYYSLSSAISDVMTAINTNGEEVRTRGDQLGSGVFAKGPADWTTQRELSGELGREDGENISDGKLSDAEAARIAARLAQANLTPEQLQALANGQDITVPASTMDYLSGLYDKSGRDGLLAVSEQLRANGSPESQQLRQYLANGMMTVSNEHVVAKNAQGVATDRGSWNKLNPEVREIIGTRPRFSTDAPDANTRDVPDDYRADWTSSHGRNGTLEEYLPDMANFADFVNSADEGYQPGQRLGVELTRQSAHQAWLLENGAYTHYEGRSEDTAKFYRLTENSAQDLLDAGSRSKEANHAILTGQGGDELFGKGVPGQSFDGYPRDDVMKSLMKHDWPDDGKVASQLVSWIGDDATSSNQDVSTRAGQAASGLAQFVSSQSKDLMNLDGAGTASVGEVNPRAVQGISTALSPYIANLAGVQEQYLPTHGFTPPDSEGSLSRDAAQKIFAVVDTDKQAAIQFNGAALSTSGDLQSAWTRSVLEDPANPVHDLAVRSGIINGLVDRGLDLETADRTKDGVIQKAHTFADKGEAYDSFKTGISTGIKYVPVVGTYAGPLIDATNTEFKNNLIGIATPPDPATPNLDTHNSLAGARQYYQVAQVLQAQDSVLAHDPRYNYLFDNDGKLKDYDVVVRERHGDQVGVYTALTNILNNYQGGVLQDPLQVMQQRVTEGRNLVR